MCRFGEPGPKFLAKTESSLWLLGYLQDCSYSSIALWPTRNVAKLTVCYEDWSIGLHTAIAAFVYPGRFGHGTHSESRAATTVEASAQM